MSSYSTLVRMAGKAKTKAERDKLMKQANALRRANRSKKSGKKVGKKAAKVDVHFQHNERMGGWRAVEVARGEAGHGEIVGSTDLAAELPEHLKAADSRYEELASLIRKKNVEHAKIVLRSLVLTGTAAGRKEERMSQRAHTLDTNRAWSNKIICSFIAEANMIQRLEGGLPIVMMMQGLQVARILDALAAAGWSEDSPPDSALQKATG